MSERKRIFDLDPNLTENDLCKRLTGLSDHLSKRPLSPDNKDETTNSISKVLLQNHLLKSKNQEIKVLVSCCIADIFRIFTPKNPYSKPQTEDIFKLFVRVLGGLGDLKSPHIHKLCYLVERLSTVRAFVLAIEYSGIKLKLFERMFSVIREEHSSSLSIHILSILISVIEESDMIEQELLHIILKNLLAKEDSNAQSARLLAWHVISRCTDKLKLPITEFLNQILMESKASSLEQFQILLLELIRINPSLLSSILPQMEAELKNDDLETRTAWVKLFSHMFSQNPDLPTTYRQLYISFLGRFKDISKSIREKMINSFAKRFITANIESKVVRAVLDELVMRLRDPDEDVRYAAVHVLCDGLLSNPQLFTGKDVDELCLRMRDKKVDIRRAAISGGAAAFTKCYESWGKLKNWGKEELKTFSGIPNKILHCYYVKNVEDRCHIEKLFEDVLMEKKETHQQEMDQLMDIISTFDDNSQLAFSAMMKDKHLFREEFRNYLEIREGTDMDKVNAKLKSVAILLPGGPSLENIKKIHKLKDEALWKNLSIIANPNSPDKKIHLAKKAIKEYRKKKKGNKSVSTFLKHIIRKLSLFNLEADHISYLFSHLNSPKTSEYTLALLQFLQNLSTTFPSFFTSSVTALTETLSDLSSGSGEKKRSSRSDHLLDATLQILANVGALFREEEAVVVKGLNTVLYDVALNGSPFQAKFAVRSIYKISKKQTALKQFENFAKGFVTMLEKNENRGSALRGLKEICKTELTIFLKHADSVVDLVFDEVLLMEVSERQIEKQNKAEKKASKTRVPPPPTPTCSSKIEALKLLTQFLLTQHEDNVLSHRFISTLLNILDAKGDIPKDSQDFCETTAVDKEYLRARAATSLIQLARFKPFERLVNVESFQKLAAITHDQDFGVRSKVLNAVAKGVSNVAHLPLRFLSLLVLYATDPERELILKAKKHLRNAIDIRRKIIKTNHNLEDMAVYSLLPENALPYVVHLLAHLPLFTKDAPAYRETSIFLTFFLQELLSGADNFALLVEMLQFIKQTEDVQDPQSKGILVVADLTLLIVQQRMDKKSFLEKHPGNVYLPPTLFRQAQNPLDTSKTHLPAGFQLLKKNRLDEILKDKPEDEEKKKKAKETKNKKTKQEDREWNDDESLESDTNKKKKKTKKSKKKKPSVEETEEEVQKPNKKSKKTKKSSKEGKDKQEGKKNKKGAKKLRDEEQETTEDNDQSKKSKNNKRKRSHSDSDEENSQKQNKKKKNTN